MENEMLKLKRKSIKWAIEHINKYNDTYIFPLPFEFEAINYKLNNVLEYLENIDVLKCGIRPYRTEITPKSQVGFRISTQLDPFDSIIYNAVLYEIADQIENARIPKEKQIIYSHRLEPKDDGTLYDEDYNWDSFNKRAKDIANSDEYNYVVVTDIGDFFSSIYLHNIETSLRECVRECGKTAHGEVLINMIKAMHSSQTHKGLPIGPQFSRPIAELILVEIDNILINNGIKHIRYVDDYRLFCTSETEAYKTLSFLAQKLYDLRNLKLNEQKTKILTIDNFKKEYLKEFKEKEHDNTLNEFYELCYMLNINTNSYDDFDIYGLEPYEIEQIEQLNIIQLLENELKEEKVDLGFIKFLLNNLAKFDNTEVADLMLKKENIIKIFPILRSFINYLERVRSFNTAQKHEIGRKVIELFEYSFITELQFNRSWLLHLFSKDDEWNNSKEFYTLYRTHKDDITLRELVQCLARAKKLEFFRENRTINLRTINPWVARSYIVGFSCLPKDERNALIKSRRLFQRDYLEELVDEWASENPF